MDDWHDLGEFVEDELEEMVVDIKTRASKSFLKKITTPSNSPEDSGNTAVDSGNLMASTYVSLDNPSDEVNSSFDTEGTTTYRKGMSVVKKAKAWQSIFIENNARGEDWITGETVFYAVKADTEGWTYTKPYYFFTNAYMQMSADVEDM